MRQTWDYNKFIQMFKRKNLNQQNYLEDIGVNVSRILKRISSTMVGC